MVSYDRLFPNQDTMPRGGFGNLIALPLQRRSGAKDNTVFVDEAFDPFPDQWTYLPRVKRIAVSTVERVAADAERSEQVLGVRASGLDDEDAPAPWLIPPSGGSMPVVPAVTEPLPALNRPWRNACSSARRACRRRSSTRSGASPCSRIPTSTRRNGCGSAPRASLVPSPRAEDLPRHLTLPRGCVDEATGLLQSLGATLDIDDQREDGHTIEHRFHGTLTALQEHAARTLRPQDIGVLVAPPGVGKTVAGVRMIAEYARSTLALVHLRPLLDQWVAQLAVFLDVNPRTIGRFDAGKRRASGVIDVATFRSLVRGGTIADLVAD